MSVGEKDNLQEGARARELHDFHEFHPFRSKIHDVNPFKIEDK
jgi:hypothetical protein